MNFGEQTIEWLYREALQVDDEWAVRMPSGFTWWADKQAQTVQVVGGGLGPDGNPGYMISVRTDFLRSVHLNEKVLDLVNALWMPFASMSGLVYERETETLRLCSLVRIHAGISAWMNPIISVAACLQIGEARIMADELAGHLGCEVATSGHPMNGVRPEPDQMTELITSLIVPMGKQPSRWKQNEFRQAVDQYMKQPPALIANAGGGGFTVEFPYGRHSSLCNVSVEQVHPMYGNGLFLLQSFATERLSDSEGAKLALTLNTDELGGRSSGYGLGSYAYREGTIHFTSFFPNAMYRPGLLPNVYFACAGRARAMSVRLANQDWTPKSFIQ